MRDLLERDGNWTDGRTHCMPHGDDTLLYELRRKTVDLSSYGQYFAAYRYVHRYLQANSDGPG